VKQTFFLCLFITSILISAHAADFQVNTRTTYDQTYPAIATDANANFAVVWSSYRHTQDGDSGGIFGQLFDSNCSPLGSEFRINTTTSGNQTRPSVAMSAAGGFVVAWQSNEADDWDVFAQRFEPNGQPIEGQFRVNTDTFSNQQSPKVTMNAAGAFAVVWESETLGGEPYAWVICCQLYDSDGLAVGDEFAVNLLLQSRYPDVAMAGNGDFTVAWVQNDMLMARQYNADGSEKADPFEVSTTAFSSATQPAIAAEPSGHFVVAWDGDPELASQDDIYAQRYKFDGTAIGEQLLVNTTSAGPQQNPSVAINSQRQFVIVWNGQTQPPGNERDIFGRRYDSSCNPIGDEFIVNTYVVADQKYPAVAIRGNDEFITAWQSNEQDGSGYGIFGQVGPKTGSADFNGDGFVDFCDYCVLAEDWLKEQNPLKTDLVDDNKINEQDLAAFSQQWLTPCYQCSQADLNTDGRIDFKDYCIWANDWLKQGPLDNDITGNGIIDFADLRPLLFYWTKTCQ